MLAKLVCLSCLWPQQQFVDFFEKIFARFERPARPRRRSAGRASLRPELADDSSSSRSSSDSHKRDVTIIILVRGINLS